ncbi:Extracellular superoxide dismutase [Cu-Zn] [Parelaphostrongylus tenuis]|uniref:Superoxide dismutase [Cu-Zn] n=1 Tax=Parelaphostrongylus tenuis TaxID=148309 RepID=A0AAD5MUT4_PARTN|nr:Extracellular superoxide dismutase [Cu-Zn] [Parelaphostrongylus tenuis]
MTHGAPYDCIRHVGDLGNIFIPYGGSAVISLTDRMIKLSGQYSVVGRAIVIHEKADDLGRGNSSLSKTTGNAGGRVACGVIRMLE